MRVSRSSRHAATGSRNTSADRVEQPDVTIGNAAQLRLSVFGLGYVGCVSAACLADRGHVVIGVDANPQKTAALRAGRAPIVEERIGELTEQVVTSGALQVSDDPTAAVHATDITIV